MAGLDYLHQAGPAVEVVGDKLRLIPADRITDAIRQYVINHRTELMTEAFNECKSASAAASDQPQRFICTVVTASSEWAAACEQFHNHLWGCHVCHAPTGRYCPTARCV